MAIRVFLIDDHPVMREGYARLVARAPGMEICGEASSAEDAFDAVVDQNPDVLLVDLSLPGENGIDFIRRIAALGMTGALLVVSAHDEAIYAERALSAGAQGYVMKNEPSSCVLDAIHRVHSGGIYLSKTLHERLLLGRIARTSTDSPRANVLTDREIEVFEHFGRGQATVEIAGQLGLSPKTVECHRARIRKKLGIKTASEFVQQAVLSVERSLATARGAAAAA
ncbi:MAG TPA: response regulator transcription factor [Rubricoccaceae bacterium]|jgi:DNA-binding NarL/FixJ family response regulator